MVEVFAKTENKNLKVYMLYDRVMKNIKNRHKNIKHMNSFLKPQASKKTKKIC